MIFAIISSCSATGSRDRSIARSDKQSHNERRPLLIACRRLPWRGIPGLASWLLSAEWLPVLLADTGSRLAQILGMALPVSVAFSWPAGSAFWFSCPRS